MIDSAAFTLEPAAVIQSAAGPASAQLTAPNGTKMQKASDAPPAWLSQLKGKIGKLRQLTPGWGGPTTRAADPYVLYRVESLLRSALEPIAGPELPFLVPMADGGVQIEWHRRGADLEISFFADGQVSALFEDRINGVEVEAEENEALDLLFRRARRVAEEDRDEPHAPIQAQARIVAVAA